MDINVIFKKTQAVLTEQKDAGKIDEAACERIFPHVLLMNYHNALAKELESQGIYITQATVDEIDF